MNKKSSAHTPIVRPVSPTTLMFDCKLKKFTFVEDLFHAMLKMEPDMSETMKTKTFPLIITKKGAASVSQHQTSQPTNCRKCHEYFPNESQVTAKHKRHKLIFDPNTFKLPDFLKKLNRAEKPLEKMHAQAMNNSLLDANLSPKLKQNVNMARLETVTLLLQSRGLKVCLVS